ncbi:MAG: hypothetical protein EZS28_041818 [Streblomastix strix]|uniref:ABC3 transporter permease C-terminal domain-containing protein n=1 Tax=Streblomastix strix TaxID=222440 RepID=A0A5J4TW09_9EUKA|nr:MAG: hypothetical protein EZS28_041818 [Streblomastix strix]
MPVSSAFEGFIYTRTFEIGILRMVGLDRFGVVGVLIAQALLYSILGWIPCIILGIVGNYFVMYILEYSSSIPLQKLMIALIIIISTLITFGISVIASILPIGQALGQNFHDSIELQLLLIIILRAILTMTFTNTMNTNDIEESIIVFLFLIL